MKKRTANIKNKKDQLKSRIRSSKPKIASVIKNMDEEDTVDFRESSSLESEDIQPDTTNWSQAQDRSEDFINETDPFIQDPEKTPKIPRDNRL